jgi:epoxyqueuosine reductase
MTLEADIKQKALELGFDAVGITTAAPIEQAQAGYFRRWLEGGNAAKMGYLYRNIDKRFAPAKLLEGARSVICVALNYRPKVAQASCLSRRRPEWSQPKINRLEACSTLRIAHFAQYEDYHPFIKERLFELAEFIKARRRKSPDYAADDEAVHFKACVDSVPLAERALAQRAGLGFIGKNRMLIHPELGCQILLGELITTLQLQPDEPLENQSCGDCGKCLRVCPTGALAPDGSFDARKCISYLTIEEKVAQASCLSHVTPVSEPRCDRDGRIPGYIFGCDECILACPHEINALPRKNSDFQFHPEWQNLTPDQIQTMTEDDFQKTFANSGFLRLGLEHLKRNCLHTKV